MGKNTAGVSPHDVDLYRETGANLCITPARSFPPQQADRIQSEGGKKEPMGTPERTLLIMGAVAPKGSLHHA